MFRRLSLAGLIGTFFPLWVSAQSTAPSWELRDGGRWVQVNAPTTAPAPDETLDLVEQMLRNRQPQPAKRLVVSWLRQNKNRDAVNRDRAVFLLGQANFLYGNRILAFYNFDELLDYYPDSRYYYPALERQYEIADLFLRGYKRRFLGMPILEAKSEATEMLYRIQQRSPGSPLAEKALLRVADHYYANGDYELAADAYAAYVRGYPRSPFLPRVRLRQAFSALAQFRGVRFDATPVIDARQQLLDLAVAYPQIAEEENITAIIQRIDVALARKLLETADFYRRTHRPTAQAYYYKYLIRVFPESREAEMARERLAGMPREAIEGAKPPAGDTRPATSPMPS